MRVPARILAAAALAAVAGSAAPADAACVGTTGTLVLCATVNPGGLPSVDPTGTSYEDCVYLGIGPCHDVVVPLPTVTPGSGRPVSVGCGGAMLPPYFACAG